VVFLVSPVDLIASSLASLGSAATRPLQRVIMQSVSIM
jgi:hypothetical protein